MLWRPLRTDTDSNTGRGPPEQNRQTGTMAELGALEDMAVQGAQEAMAVQGAQEAMAVQGAQEAIAKLGALAAMAELGAQEAMADHLRGLGLGPLGPAPTAGTLTTPQKNFPGVVRGYQEPFGAGQTGQYMTGQESLPGARQTGQDSPQEQEVLLGELGS